MTDEGVEWWIATAKKVYTDLRDTGLEQEEAADLAEAVLSEIGRDRRTEQIGEQRRAQRDDGPRSDDWREKPVSDRQKEVLMQEGYTQEQLDEMTRGEASDELDDILGED